MPRALRISGIVVASVLGALIVLAAFALGWIGIRGGLAYAHLQRAQAAASTLRENLTDPAAAPHTIQAIAAETAAAHALTDDVVWRAGESVPWLGPQLSTVSTVAASVDDVAGSALPPLADVAATFSLDAVRPTNGRIDLSTFVKARDAAATGAREIDRATTSVDAIDRGALVSPLRGAVGDLTGLLHELRDGTGALARATVLLPAMLGADGPRDYLVLFQNNAEWRSLGGNPGAMALLHTDHGAITLAAQESTGDFPQYPKSVVPLGDEVEAIYGDRPGRWMQDITQVPDFAVTGALAREMWARQHDGQQVDGVIALDAVTLSYLLEATGPVTLPTGDVLTPENAVPLLLNEVYGRYAIPAEQDAFFAAASAAVFNALAQGSAEPSALLTALTRAGDERRLLLWSAHDDDQQVLAGTTLTGALPQSDADAARFGLYLNDGTGSKMDYYATADTTVAWDTCTLDAARTATGTATMTVTVRSNAPPDAATLPIYITGGDYGVPLGTTRTVGYLYLPEGFELTSANLTGDLGFGGGTHDGRRVLSFTVDLPPGASATATVTVRAPAGSAPRLEVQSTPTLVASPVVADICARP